MRGCTPPRLRTSRRIRAPSCSSPLPGSPPALAPRAGGGDIVGDHRDCRRRLRCATRAGDAAAARRGAHPPTGRGSSTRAGTTGKPKGAVLTHRNCFYEPLLLRGHRRARRARHPVSMRSAVARRRTLCLAAFAARRHQVVLPHFRGRGDHRRGATPPQGLDVRGPRRC